MGQISKSWPYRDNLEHLLARDVPVAVQVVHAEGPLELLLQLAARGDAQRADELAEVYRPVPVGVKGAEHVLRKLRGVTVREEITVDLLELLHGEVAARAVFEEAFVPLLDLIIRELCVGPEILQDLRLELAILFPHDELSMTM